MAYQSLPPLAPRNEGLTSALLPTVGDSFAVGEPINEKVIDDHLAVQAIIRRFQVKIVMDWR